ncbi:heterokaryon incompatibility protein domain-containing protein [Trichoderma novae-zelandiae]
MSLFDFKPLEPYEYSPLPSAKRVIRLIQLLPPKPSIIPGAFGTIRIRLVEAEVDSGVCYDALSYSWNVPAGQLEPNRQIIIETDDDSRKLYIFPALEIALFHLVSQGMTDRFFIDQISINQKDNNEKNRQVLLMQDVYAKSARTLVWLGPPTRASDRYFDVLREICSEGVLCRVMGPRVSQFMHVFDAVMDPALQVDEEQREDRDDLLDLIARYGDRFPLDGFADILDRNWFNRLWVVQEACLAPLVIFVCGSKSLCFDCFRSGALFYNIYNTHWVHNVNEALPQRVLRERDALFGKTGGLIRIFQERKAIHQTMIRQSLHDLILKYNVNNGLKKIGASMEQDRIYGLLGLAANDDALKGRVRVDYDAKVIRMYSEIAEILLQESIDILLFNQHPKKTQGLPAWVPDWAMDLSIPIGYVTLKEPAFNAGGPQTEAPVRLEGEEPQLRIDGILVDVIQEVGTRLHHAQSDSQVSEQIEYRSAKLFFDEVSEFVRGAIATAQSRDASFSAADVELGLQMRLCDSSLSYRHFTQSLGTTAGIERLQALHSAIYVLGDRLIRSDEQIASYSITRIYRTIGIVPWYWEPMSEMESLRTCALNPALAGKIAGQAIYDFVIDMTGLCLASARVWYASKVVKWRRRFGKMNLRPNPESIEKVGLNAGVSFGPDMNVFTSNMFKNRGRKLYRTTAGYVGLGPATMRAGDSVVIFRGGTTPHILSKLYDDSELEKYEYVGEAYCDGVMNGEIFQDETRREETFVLV